MPRDNNDRWFVLLPDARHEAAREADNAEAHAALAEQAADTAREAAHEGDVSAAHENADDATHHAGRAQQAAATAAAWADKAADASGTDEDEHSARSRQRAEAAAEFATGEADRAQQHHEEIRRRQEQETKANPALFRAAWRVSRAASGWTTADFGEDGTELAAAVSELRRTLEP